MRSKYDTAMVEGLQAYLSVDHGPNTLLALEGMLRIVAPILQAEGKPNNAAILMNEADNIDRMVFRLQTIAKLLGVNAASPIFGHVTKEQRRQEENPGGPPLH